MPVIEVEGLTFTVSNDFLVSKYDEWSFYRNQILLIEGAKAIDLLISARDKSIAYLVEIKDFTVDPVTRNRRTRTKPTELHDEIASKILDSLGGILAARTCASDPEERKAATLTCEAGKLRVVLHLEQSGGTRLFPRVVDPANLQIKLRQKVKAIDPHAVVVSTSKPGNFPWTVS